MPLFRYLKRQWIQRRHFPAGWERVLSSRVPVFRNLPEPTRVKLRRRMLVFLDEKLFEGCGGLTVTDEHRVVIAAHACLLIVEEASDYYAGLTSILLYPKDYLAPVYEQDPGGVVTEGWESRSGESWNPGNIVLSWDDIRRDLLHPHDGKNLIYHEFAHQLDYRYGLSADIGMDGETDSEDPWTQMLADTYQRLRGKARRRQPDLLDHYGATNPAECFAVATECFLEQPEAMRQEYPELYGHFASFYGFDPVLLLNDKSSSIK